MNHPKINHNLLAALLAPSVKLLAGGTNAYSMTFARTVYYAGCVLMGIGEWLIEQRSKEATPIADALRSAAAVDVQTLQEASLSMDLGFPVPTLENAVVNDGN